LAIADIMAWMIGQASWLPCLVPPCFTIGPAIKNHVSRYPVVGAVWWIHKRLHSYVRQPGDSAAMVNIDTE
jgi:hypothetical protein